MYLVSKMVVFHCYVSLPESNNPQQRCKRIWILQVDLVIPPRGPAMFFQQLDFPIKKTCSSKNAVGRTFTKQSQYLNILIHNMFIYLLYTRYILGGFTIEPSFLFKGRYIRCVYIYIYINVAAQTSTFSSWLFGCLDAPPESWFHLQWAK